MIYLASKSPQRKALLEALGIDFEILLPDYHEDDRPGEAPAALVERHSRGKALSVLRRVAPLGAGQAVLGVDTMVVFEGRALGKAADASEAYRYLSALSGSTHEVYSGLTLLLLASEGGGGKAAAKELTGYAVTRVRFASIPDEELRKYVETGEWKQRAGAYAIQGKASSFVEEVRGDYTNVVGLPAPLLVSFLRECGLWPPSGWLEDR